MIREPVTRYQWKAVKRVAPPLSRPYTMTANKNLILTPSTQPVYARCRLHRRVESTMGPALSGPAPQAAVKPDQPPSTPSQRHHRHPTQPEKAARMGEARRGQRGMIGACKACQSGRCNTCCTEWRDERSNRQIAPTVNQVAKKAEM